MVNNPRLGHALRLPVLRTLSLCTCCRHYPGAAAEAGNVRNGVCAVTRRRFPVGANPTRRTLQPEATGAVMEVTKWLKPSDSVLYVTFQILRERTSAQFPPASEGACRHTVMHQLKVEPLTGRAWSRKHTEHESIPPPRCSDHRLRLAGPRSLRRFEAMGSAKRR